MNALTTGKRVARRVGLAVFARVNPGDVTIKHHYTTDPFRLHSFRHKGYWFHGRRREQQSMAAFAQFVRPGDHVLEIGGHIGYITRYLAGLVGTDGAIHVFEPALDNLRYLQANVGRSPVVRIVPKAAGHNSGFLPLYVEDLTGQNNSLVPRFEGLIANQRNAIRARIVEQRVEVVSVDSYLAEVPTTPDFIKIDVEGYEWEVLRGAEECLTRDQPVLMVEVQRHRTKIRNRLRDKGYRLFTPTGTPLDEIPAGTTNVFCVPSNRQLPDGWCQR